ncbi:MAG TPA: uridine kinase [Lactovum miscens]|uniref:uridine kinase n=1 Tax=Lactovum miscens TaxID=190387 RepID=UPI002ED98F6E
MSEKMIIIGVTGGSASGKTSIAEEIFNSFPDESVGMIQHDSYYKEQTHLTLEERHKTNYDHPLAFDTDLLITHLNELLKGNSVQVPVYDYKISNRSDKTVIQEPTKVLIVEGVLVLEDKRLRDLMDIKIFVDTDDDIRLIRRIRRDIQERGRSMDSVLEQYLRTVKPMHHQFVQPQKRYANIIVPNWIDNEVAVDILRTKVFSFLNESGTKKL